MQNGNAILYKRCLCYVILLLYVLIFHFENGEVFVKGVYMVKVLKIHFELLNVDI